MDSDNMTEPRFACTMKMTSVLLAVIFLLPVAAATGSGDHPYPGSGTWRISQDTAISGEVIVVNGDLIVEDGADFQLTDTTIIINCTSPDQYRVIIRPDASVGLVRSHIVPANSSIGFRFIVEEPPAARLPLSPLDALIVGMFLGLGMAFPTGIALTAYIYKRWFSRNLPPPV